MITLIAAVAHNNVIGKDGRIPWNAPEELRLFKAITTGHSVIMGRRTFESIGRPLPQRRNIVISKHMHTRPGISVARSIEEAFTIAPSSFVIGGGDIFSQTIEYADTLILSHMKQAYEGDTYFPEFSTDYWHISDQKEYDKFIHITYSKYL